MVATKSSVALTIFTAGTDSTRNRAKFRLRRSLLAAAQSDLITRRLLGAQNDAYSGICAGPLAL